MALPRDVRSHPRIAHAGEKTRGRRKYPARQCSTGKMCYGQAEARVMAERMMTAGAVDPGCHVEPYLCRTCKDWHVGNRKIVFPPE